MMAPFWTGRFKQRQGRTADMPRVARYTVVVDETMVKVPSATANKLDIGFEMPSDFVAEGPTGRFNTDVVLIFQAHAFDDPDGIQVQLSINGRDVYKYGPTSENLSRAFIVTFGDNYLNPGTNMLTLEKKHGDGTLGVSNAVIWHHTFMGSTAQVRGKSATSKTAPKRTPRKQTRARSKGLAKRKPK
jgi:hypothetical protein